MTFSAKDLLVLALCLLGGAVLMSLLLIAGSMALLDAESMGGYPQRFNALAGAAGALIGGAAFFFTRGRGVLKGRKQ